MSQVADRTALRTGTPTDGVPAPVRRDLRLTGLRKEYAHGFVAVQSLDLHVPQGSFFALLGPSGCGKTTTLRMIAGLETATAGSVTLGADEITHVKPYRRPVNTVFQSYALFPHLSIAENVAFGLRRRGVKKVAGPVAQMLELTELTAHARKKPAQLSGGQQQRVALARALVNRPDVLLLDEPLGALDLRLRRAMQLELKRIQSELGATFVHVTHDQEEAMTMADTIAVMNHGVIEQTGGPAELYDNPRTTFVANFLGQSNLVGGRVLGVDGDVVHVDAQGAVVSVPVDRAHTARTPGTAGRVGIRPEKVLVAPRGEALDAPGDHLTGGVVVDSRFSGVSVQYLVRMPWGQEMLVFEQNTGRRGVITPGTAVDVSWRPEHAFLLDAGQDVHAGTEAD